MSAYPVRANGDCRTAAPRSNPRLVKFWRFHLLSHPQRDKTERFWRWPRGHLSIGLSSIIAVTGAFQGGRVCQPRASAEKAMPRSTENTPSAPVFRG